MRTVSIVQRILPHYRLGFFERLHARLAGHGVHLRLCYGQEHPGSRPGSIHYEGTWVRRIRNRYLFNDGGDAGVVWQPCLRELAQSDLVIAEHAARLLINYPLAALSRLGGARLALWGHGTNLQGENRRGIASRMRHTMTQGAHWWFAYTELSARIVAGAGYPSERITVVNNAIDTEALGNQVFSTTSQQRAVLRHELGLTTGGTGIFCGRLVAEKRLDLLCEACEQIHRKRPWFRLLVVGDGPEERRLRSMADAAPWMRFVGPKYGAELALYLSVSDFLLMPGLVGLVIVDAFAAEVPLITTNHGRHSPEIAYLKHGENAVMTEVDAAALAAEVVSLIDHPARLERLREGCRASASEYTLARMVDRFSSGVMSALAH